MSCIDRYLVFYKEYNFLPDALSFFAIKPEDIDSSLAKSRLKREHVRELKEIWIEYNTPKRYYGIFNLWGLFG